MDLARFRRQQMLQRAEGVLTRLGGLFPREEGKEARGQWLGLFRATRVSSP